MTDPLPQAWVPRVLNVALAVVFLALLAPIATNLGDKPTYVRVALVLLAIPFGLLALACLSSAVRPGSLGRAVRRLRARRTRAASPDDDPGTSVRP
ncbi:MAG: hypothetical protein JWN08_2012 [Frankiales bacterium]|jgi:peptidoglycan/LPS O-acetylase OafA/YrhL|nr:hypothetical protein [Frankiales bacterium]